MPRYWGRDGIQWRRMGHRSSEFGIGVLYFHHMGRQVTSSHLCLGFSEQNNTDL